MILSGRQAGRRNRSALPCGPGLLSLNKRRGSSSPHVAGGGRNHAIAILLTCGPQGHMLMVDSGWEKRAHGARQAMEA